MTRGWYVFVAEMAAVAGKKSLKNEKLGYVERKDSSLNLT